MTPFPKEIQAHLDELVELVRMRKWVQFAASFLQGWIAWEEDPDGHESDLDAWLKRNHVLSTDGYMALVPAGTLQRKAVLALLRKQEKGPHKKLPWSSESGEWLPCDSSDPDAYGPDFLMTHVRKVKLLFA